MTTEESGRRMVVAALLLALASAAVSFGCGGRSGSGTSGSAGTAGVEPRLCDATLEIPERAPIELDCQVGIRPGGGGIYRLDLASAQGDTVTLDLPSIESGFSASPECLTASIQLVGSNTYLADQLAFADSVATLSGVRDGNVLSGTVAGILYALGDGGPVPYITPTVRLANIPILQQQLTCDCGAPRNYDDHCEISTCDTGSCALVACPVGAKLCQALR